MIEYAKFLFKRILLKKSNYFVVVVSVLLITTVLIMNINSQNNLLDIFIQQGDKNEKLFELYEEKQKEVETDSQSYDFYEKNKQLAITVIQRSEKLIGYFESSDWNNFYDEYISTLKSDLHILNQSKEANEEDGLNQSTLKQLAYFNYLKEYNLEYEDYDYPIYGASFVNYISSYFMPIMVLICSIYILSQLYTMDSSDKMDISNLMPLGERRIFCIKIFVGISISILILLFLLLFSFTISTLLSSNTGFLYPYMSQTGDLETWLSRDLLQLICKWAVLAILFYISVTVFTYLSSLLIHDEGTLFLFTICFIIGLFFLPNIFKNLQDISHYLPTTYLDFVNVSNGNLAMQYSNTKLCFVNGMKYLLVFIFLELSICTVLKHKLNR